MITLLDRYIGRSVFLGTLLVLGVLLALFIFVVLVDALPDYGRGSFGLYELARYVILSQPRKIYELFPIAVLIGSLLGLSTLALNSELIAIRAAGFSKARIVGAALKTGLVLIAITMILGEYVVPTTETMAQTGRAHALITGLQKSDSGLWLRDGKSFVRLGEVLPDLSLLRVSIYEFEAETRLRAYTYAARARYSDSGWLLEDVRRSIIGDRGVRTETMATERWQANLVPQLLSVFAVKPEALSIAQLASYIEHLQKNHQDAGRYALAFWQKILLPLTIVLMVLMATPFVFRPVRSGGLAQRVFIGVMMGLGVIVLYRSFGYAGLLYGVPAEAAAVAPLLLFLLFAVFLLRRTY